MPDDIILDVAGRPVNCSTHLWELNTAGNQLVLDWTRLDVLPEPVRNAARMYVRDRIPEWAPPTVRGLFYMYELLAECSYFENKYDGTLEFAAFEELREDDRAGSAELTRYRNWYEWTANLQLPGFDRAVSRQLKKVKIGANPHGRRARKKDPDLGPLTDKERQTLLNKTLKASNKVLSLQERVAILLGMGLGANAGPYALLQVQDYFTEAAGTTTYHFLMMPRHKKGFERERFDFKRRPIEAKWAEHLTRLIARNRRTADRVYLRSGRAKPDNVAIPIFMRDEVRTDLTPAMAEYELHLTPQEFTQLLKRGCERLNARSRKDERLHINQRRFRSTFATNLIANGMSKQQVAEALDQLSTASLKHYEFEDDRLVESLDARLGEAMKRLTGAFLGTLTEKSSEATRNRRPSTRRAFFDRDNSRGEDLGNCGTSAKCDLPVPLGCYTCPLFEPWTEAPHERLLEQLLADREQRKRSGMHPRIVAIQDPTIEALGEVIARIKAGNSEAA